MVGLVCACGVGECGQMCVCMLTCLVPSRSHKLVRSYTISSNTIIECACVCVMEWDVMLYMPSVDIRPRRKDAADGSYA